MLQIFVAIFSLLLIKPDVSTSNDEEELASLLQPLPFGIDTGSITSDKLPQMPIVSVTFILPYRNVTQAKVRDQLKRYFQVGSSPQWLRTPFRHYGATVYPQRRGSGTITRPRLKILPRFQANLVYTPNLSVSESVRRTFCSKASHALNVLVAIIRDKVESDDECRLTNFLTTLAGEAGVPSMLWSTSPAYQIDDITTSAGNFHSVKKRLILLSPSMREQAYAIMDFLRTHKLKACALVVVMSTPGAEDFIRFMVESAQHEVSEKNIQQSDAHEEHVKVSTRLAHKIRLPGGRDASQVDWRRRVRSELMHIRDSARARVILLWCSAEDANEIFSEARILGMTAESYLWIGGKPLIGDNVERLVASSVSTMSGRRLINIVPGTVVASYDTTFEAQLEVIKAATEIWMRAVRRLVALPTLRNVSELAPTNLCADGKRKPWRFRNQFLKFLEDAKYESTEMSTAITSTGRTVVFSFLDNDLRWRRLGNWTTSHGFVANESSYNNWMVVRGKSNSTDRSTFLEIATLEEPPYIIYSDPDPFTGQCPNSGVPCDLSPLRSLSNETGQWHPSVGNKTSHVACCSGLCIDLLRRLSSDLNFHFHIFEVRDRKWGGIDKVTGEWNGLVRALLDEEADLETGITIMVAVRPGAISPMALLEPFSPSAWFAILFGCVTAVVLSSSIFEQILLRGGLRSWRSGVFTKRNASSKKAETFSVFSALWLVWAMLFKAAVRVTLPNSLGAKLLTAIWGMFCVIFASSYMANLAVFMITKDDFYDFSGLEDYRLTNPYTKQPPYRFGTINSGATEAFIKQNYPSLYEYMRQFNQTSCADGIAALKEGKLDAFIYDATVLEYKSSRDPDCSLNVVGKWYAMTGYGIGFPRGSTWLPAFERYIIDYQYSGILQHLAEYWLTGVCKYRKQAESSKSFQLGIVNFTSAFALLILGLAFCSFVLGAEFFISKYLARYFIRKKDREYQKAMENYKTKKSMATLTQALVLKESALMKKSGLNRRRPAVSGTSEAESGTEKRKFSGICGLSTVKCINCDGFGHVVSACSSHPDTHFLLKGYEAKNDFGDGEAKVAKSEKNSP